jgi:spermidine synthase
LIIGLGTASLTKFFYRYYPLAHLTVVEIEPSVIAASRQFFKLPEDPHRINLVISCGAEYLMNSKQQFDLIMVDGYDRFGRSGALDTRLFYLTCRNRLSANGMMVANLLGRSRGFNSSLGRIFQTFDDRALLFPSCESGNAIVLAAVGDKIEISFDELKENALALKEKTGLNLLPTLARLAKTGTCLNNNIIL